MTELIDAVRANDLLSVKGLLASGADLEDMGMTGDTPLVEAATRGLAPVVDALLQGGARIEDPRRVDSVLLLELLNGEAKQRGSTAIVALNPIVAAAVNGHVETVELLESKLAPLPWGKRWIELRHARHVAARQE